MNVVNQNKYVYFLLIAILLATASIAGVAGYGIYQWEKQSKQLACVRLGELLSKNGSSLYVYGRYMVKTVDWENESEWMSELPDVDYPQVIFSEVMAGITVTECEELSSKTIPNFFHVRTPDGTTYMEVPIGWSRDRFSESAKLNEEEPKN